MASVNIPSYHDDPNYRYKMPRVKAKVEGRGNGVKTNIMNMGEIARALKRAPEYATKFCGCELGASSKFESAEGKAIVNGIHPEADVQVVIDKFIERFVLCPKCKLPEIDLGVVQGRVKGTCNACGFAGDMDNAHKVATFIVKNPPANNDSTMGKKASSKEGKDAKDKKEKRKDGAKEGGKEGKEKKKKRHHHHHHAVKQSLTYDSEEIAQVIERLVNYLQKGEKPTPKEFFQEVRLLQVAQDFSGTLRVYCALAAIHRAENAGTDALLTAELLKKYLPYLAATCDRSIDGGMVLEAVENFIQRLQPPAAWNAFSVLLSTLYQADVIEEDTILKRYGGPLPKPKAPSAETSAEAPSAEANAAPEEALEKAHHAAGAFVRWLREAESASSSEDEQTAPAKAPAKVADSSVPSRESSSSSSSSDEEDDDDA